MVVRKFLPATLAQTSASMDTPRVAQQENLTATSSFPIVGIGASAGGLEAFDLFFRHVPPDSGMAFVLVSHLDPNHASILNRTRTAVASG